MNYISTAPCPSASGLVAPRSTAIQRALGRKLELILDLIAILRIHGLRSTHFSLLGNAVILGHFTCIGVLPGKIVRNPARLHAFVPDDAGRAPDGDRVGAQVIGPSQNIGLG